MIKTKIGRNEPCPCGSGKKYKQCCLNKIHPIFNTDSRAKEEIFGVFGNEKGPEIYSFYLKNKHKEPQNYSLLKRISDLGSSEYLDMKNFLISFPILVDNDYVIAHIAMDLGSCDRTTEINLAIDLMNSAVNISEKNNNSKQANEFKASLAAMYAQINQIDKALKLINEVSDGTSRKNVIKANLLMQDGKRQFNNILPLYENAIKEEPKFHLPYYRIIDHLDFNSEIREHWLNVAIENCTDSPEIAFKWIENNFYKHNYHKILKKKISKSIKDESGDISIVGRRDDNKFFIAFINSAETISEIFSQEEEYENINLKFEESVQALINLKDKINFDYCKLGKNLHELMLEKKKIGDFNIFKKILDLLVCGNCKSAIDIEATYLNFKITRPLNSVLINEVNSFFGKKKKEKDLREYEILFVNYLSKLDDEKKYSTIFNLITEYADIIKTTNVRLKLFWDSSYYYSKIGEWQTTIYFLNEFKKLFSEVYYSKKKDDDFEKEQNVENDFSKYLDAASWLNSNLIIAYCGIKDFQKAEDVFCSSNDLVFFKFKNIQFQLEDVEKKKKDLSEFINECKKNANSKKYLNLFTEDLKKISWANSWGGKIMPSFKKTNINLFENNDLTIKNKIEISKCIMHDSLGYKGDFSDIFNSVETIIPNFRLFPETAINCLLEAETRYHDNVRVLDYSPTITSYCKSLEIILKKNLFDKFREKKLKDNDLENLLNEAKSDKKVSQFVSLINFFKTSRIELGSMNQIITLLDGKTVERVTLLKDLKQYIENYYPMILENNYMDQFKEMINVYRNPATHEKIFSAEEMKELRNKIFTLLNTITQLRIVN